MPRPQRCRLIGEYPVYRSFSPDDVNPSDSVIMTLDEFEVFRLLDYEGCTQEQCARRMNISRTTVTAIYEKVRKKISEMLVDGKRLMVSGGNYSTPELHLPQIIISKGESVMRIAVTYEKGDIFQHFGHTEQFKIYDVENGRIQCEQIVDTNGSGHGALAGFLQAAKVDSLICGGIGMGAKMALDEVGIKLFPGAQGSADDAVKNLIAGTLQYNPDTKCDHHEHHDGDCGHDHCADHHCRGN